MLAVRCQFLQGTYAAAAPGRQAEAEWPPHPARFHAALVAAAWAVSDGEPIDPGLREALDWLESSVPTLAGGENVGFRSASRGESLPTAYVPRNLSPKETSGVAADLEKGTDISRQIGRTPRVFPTAVPGDDPIWFVWQDLPPPAVHEGIARLVAAVQYLGSSRSPVCCGLDDKAPQPWLVPVPDEPARAEASMRVATRGTTERLLRSRFERLAGGFGTPLPYGRPALSVDRVQPLRGPFGSLLVRRVTGGTGLDISRAWRVARAFRSAVLSHAGDHAPEALHGHGPLPHCAFLPLPAVGHPGAGGRITGLAVAIPRGLDDVDAGSIRAAVSKVTELNILGLPQRWKLASIGPVPPLWSVMPGTWSRPSRLWRSVTPVALDRHPKLSHGEGPADLLVSSVRTALGDIAESKAPPVRRAAVLRGSAVAGAPPRRAFRHLPDVGMLVDAEVEFEQPLEGPLVVGRRRHFGIGLFLPTSEGPG